MFRRLSSGKDALGSTTATAAGGFAAAARFATTARLAAAAPIAMEQAAQAAQDAAAMGLAARIATAARFATTAGLSGTTTARLSGAAGLGSTTTAGFATAARLAAARFAAAIVVAAEQVEQAAAMAAARIATTARLTTTARLVATAVAKQAKTRGSVVGAREHQQGAQDKRRKTNTSVHRRLLSETETGGEHTWERRDANSPRTIAHLASAYRSPRRIAAIAAHDVENVIQRYRPPSFTSFTDRRNLPKFAVRRPLVVVLCGLFSFRGDLAQGEPAAYRWWAAI